jgi:hypothetical protein
MKLNEISGGVIDAAMVVHSALGNPHSACQISYSYE